MVLVVVGCCEARYVRSWRAWFTEVDELSVFSNPDLGDPARGAVTRSVCGLSGRSPEAVRVRLRAEALPGFLDGWEAEHGADC